MTATPRPWVAEGQTVPAGEFWAVAGAGAETVAERTSEADAALIVQAVNAHDDLVAALAKARDALFWCGGSPSFSPEGEAYKGWIEIALPAMQKAHALLHALDAASQQEEGL